VNKTKIEWTDYTWNPLTGCWGPGGTAEKPNRCAYCYAKGMAKRFSPFEKTGYVQIKMQCINNDPFQPLFWPDRLDQPAKVKKPSKIFVCSMGDLFGDWVPDRWINSVLNVTKAPYADRHTFQFLTKNPKRLKDFNPWPSNCWVGTTVTNQADADERLPWLLKVDAPVRFVSHEPLLAETDIISFIIKEYTLEEKDHIRKFGCAVPNRFVLRDLINWAIIGAMTGPGAVRPEVDWVMDLAQQYKDAGVPRFLKDNLGFKGQPKEFPIV
jgi:protein gp37